MSIYPLFSASLRKLIHMNIILQTKATQETNEPRHTKSDSVAHICVMRPFYGLCIPLQLINNWVITRHIAPLCTFNEIIFVFLLCYGRIYFSFSFDDTILHHSTLVLRQTLRVGLVITFEIIYMKF